MVQFLTFQVKNLGYNLYLEPDKNLDRQVAYLDSTNGRFFCLDCGLPDDLSDEEKKDAGPLELDCFIDDPLLLEHRCDRCGKPIPEEGDLKILAALSEEGK